MKRKIGSTQTVVKNFRSKSKNLKSLPMKRIRSTRSKSLKRSKSSHLVVAEEVVDVAHEVDMVVDAMVLHADVVVAAEDTAASKSRMNLMARKTMITCTVLLPTNPNVNSRSRKT